jgi:hypothetical protein
MFLMPRPLRRGMTAIRATVRSALHDRSGLALIEFAYILPLMLTVGLAGTETANLAIVTLRINQLAMLAADNAARVRGTMDETDVNEVMIGMRFAGSNIKFGERGRVIISDIESNLLPITGGLLGNKITWQRCFGAKNASSMYGPEGTGALSSVLKYGVLPTGIATATSNPAGTVPVPGGALIVAEIRYTYQPLVAGMFMGTRELKAVQTFPVRERAGQALTNSTSMPDTAKRLCDAAHLSAT